jgi:hypothetical protein
MHKHELSNTYLYLLSLLGVNDSVYRITESTIGHLARLWSWQEAAAAQDLGVKHRTAGCAAQGHRIHRRD